MLSHFVLRGNQCPVYINNLPRTTFNMIIYIYWHLSFVVRVVYLPFFRSKQSVVGCIPDLMNAIKIPAIFFMPNLELIPVLRCVFLDSQPKRKLQLDKPRTNVVLRNKCPAYDVWLTPVPIKCVLRHCFMLTPCRCRLSNIQRWWHHVKRNPFITVTCYSSRLCVIYHVTT